MSTGGCYISGICAIDCIPGMFGIMKPPIIIGFI
jgi:hypothetical protein